MLGGSKSMALAGSAQQWKKMLSTAQGESERDREREK